MLAKLLLFPRYTHTLLSHAQRFFINIIPRSSVTSFRFHEWSNQMLIIKLQPPLWLVDVNANYYKPRQTVQPRNTYQDNRPQDAGRPAYQFAGPLDPFTHQLVDRPAISPAICC